jgi:hypothetical protein
VSKEKEKWSKRKVPEIQEEFEKKFRGSDGKTVESEPHVQGVYSEDSEIDSILHESIQEKNKVCCGKSCSCALSFQRVQVLVLVLFCCRLHFNLCTVKAYTLFRLLPFLT